MQRILPGPTRPLHDVAATRRIESALAARLPAHELMRRAGLATARLALAIAPHHRRTWIACGPGNNGGDGLEAAIHLHHWGREVSVSLSVPPDRLPADASAAYERALAAGVAIASSAPPDWDLAIDAMLGIGSTRPLRDLLGDWQARMGASGAPVLAIDVPSGLQADTGHTASVMATHTLSLLTLKPGLFTGHGRDAAGEIWFDDLGAGDRTEPPSAELNPAPCAALRPHASHKGSFGDVAVVGGAPGMAGAALLAGRAALNAGAGRVFVALLDSHASSVDATQPELMLRDLDRLDLSRYVVACGCGGGDAVAAVLPRVLATAPSVVLDADALNALAVDAHLRALVSARGQRTGWRTVLTPHPLEAARLLGCGTSAVQADRVDAARQLCARHPGAVVVLKGSGTVVAAAGRTPRINATGNARLATAGTGDVLAGGIAARLAAGESAFDAASAAVYLHGAIADRWPPAEPLTASRLAASR